MKPFLVETRGRVGLITLNRPKALNALNPPLLGEVDRAASRPVSRPTTASAASCITGSEKAFAAGADIKEMPAKSYIDAFIEDFFARLGRVSRACASR